MKVGMSVERVIHSLGVANLMQNIVRKSKHHDITSLNESDMFLLGYIHDIGYQFTTDQIKHSFVGGNIMKDIGYKYYKEIRYHGFDQDSYVTPELTILNYADMKVNLKGDIVKIRDRVHDIKARYGANSTQVREAINLAKSLKYNDYDFIDKSEFVAIDSW